MSPPYVRLTLVKELRETLRDRRTLTVMILFPLVVYPLLALLGTQVMASREKTQSARPSSVAIVGDDAAEIRRRLGESPALFVLRGNGTREEVDDGRLDALVQVTSGKPQAKVEILFDTTRDESRRAEARLTEVLQAALPAGCAPTYDLSRRDLAPGTRLGGYVLSKALPLMIVLMVLLGAFYPAIDVTAGERERGTLETILASPVPRTRLLLGKILAVTLLASVTGFLNLGSMSVTLVQVIRLADPATALPIPWTRAAAVGLIVLPTAFLLAAIFVAVGSLARGFKEAQNYLVPVYFLFFAPAILASMGDFPLTAAGALVPGLNVSLLARDIALGKASLGMSALVLGATLLYGGVALAAAARLYASERFLAGTDDAPSARRRWGGPRLQQPPTPGEALALFAIGYLLLYFLFIPLQRRDLVSGLMVSQWGGLAGVVILFVALTGRTARAALGSARPGWLVVLGAALMGSGGWLLANAISLWLLPPPQEYVEALRRTLFPTVGQRGLLVSLFLFALTPAVCEELFFRGPILRGLAARASPAAAIAICGILFGLFHIDVWRLLPTSLLGVMLSWIAWRGGSVLPAMLAHFLNNAILVVLGHAGLEQRFEHAGVWIQTLCVATAALAVAAGCWCVTRGARSNAGL